VRAGTDLKAAALMATTATATECARWDLLACGACGAQVGAMQAAAGAQLTAAEVRGPGCTDPLADGV
jgi:hypothetical protein